MTTRGKGEGKCKAQKKKLGLGFIRTAGWGRAKFYSEPK
jgi:hypothetical protein